MPIWFIVFIGAFGCAKSISPGEVILLSDDLECLGTLLPENANGQETQKVTISSLQQA